MPVDGEAAHGRQQQGAAPQKKSSTIIDALRECDRWVCMIGCLSLVPGLVRRVVNQLAFFPPRPPGYHVNDDRQVFLVEADYGLTPLPDLTSEGIAVDTVRMWTSRGNVILGFHFRRADSSKTLLFSHGNSTDIGVMFHQLKELCMILQVDIFAYEYSGYGGSSGSPSEENLYADIEAAHHYLLVDCDIPAEQVVCYGQSIGSVPSLDLASKSDVGGVILHSAMKSGLSVIHSVMKADYWFDVFLNVAKIRKVQAPVFIMHGTQDVEVPWEHGVALYEACPAEFAYHPWWVREAKHNDIETHYKPMYFRQILRFLKALDYPERFSGRKEEGQINYDIDGDNGNELSSETGQQPLLWSSYSYEPMNNH